jgi:hypothetical protein
MMTTLHKPFKLNKIVLLLKTSSFNRTAGRVLEGIPGSKKERPQIMIFPRRRKFGLVCDLMSRIHNKKDQNGYN